MYNPRYGGKQKTTERTRRGGAKFSQILPQYLAHIVRMDHHALSINKCLEKLGVNPKTGLSGSDAKHRLHIQGTNVLTGKKAPGFFLLFISQFKDFMLLILLAAAAISFGTAYLEGDGDYMDPIMIFGIVCLNAFVSAIQEKRAQKSLEALRAMSAPHATVLRDGELRSILAADLVPGDIITLATGDLIPADCRILESVGLRTQESALTGESNSVRKNAALTLARSCPLAERGNMLFSSTAVAAGHTTALVVATGMNTELGKIAHMLGREKTPQTPLQCRLEKVGKTLSLIALGLCGLIFALHLLRAETIMNSFLLAVSLAVAAVPEGLPATVTVVLSLGVQRMARRGAILRSLPAVETLGAATVICSDKTGTLTQNEMRVADIRGNNGLSLSPKSPQAQEILRIGALCNNGEILQKRKSSSRRKGIGNKKTVRGDSTETGILLAADDVLDINALRREYPRVAENPFTSERKRMSTLHKCPDGLLLAVKGAPDVLLPLCDKAGGLPMSDAGRREILRQVAALAGEGLRVLAIAQAVVRNQNTGGKNFGGNTKEKMRGAEGSLKEENLTFCGLIALHDPPRKEAKQAVEICKEAGIVPVMITGDHALTAAAIARQLRIVGKNAVDDQVVTGNQLDKMSDDALQKKLDNTRVFARVSPEHKLRIVKAFRARGEVVAMTGDGVNDAPALKAADIGCAMGKSGTEVAKSAADMVLTDDNFSTIVAAVSEGRGIYDNIKKAVHFLLSCNIGEIFLILSASIFGMPAPLLPIHLLLVNLVTDALPAMALGTEPKERDIMRRRPIPPNQSLFAGGLGKSIPLEGCLVGLLALAAFTLGCTHLGGSLEVGRSMCFATLSLSELVHALNMRSDGSAIKAGLFKNWWLNGAIAFCAVFQILIISIPALAAIFSSVPLDMMQWMVVGGLSLTMLIVIEGVKLVFSRGSKSV